MKKKILLFSIIIILLFLSFITIYFYIHHRVIVHEYQINRKFTFDDLIINIDKMSIKNSEKKEHIGTNFIIDLAMKSQNPNNYLYYIGGFYLKPYNRLDYNILTIRATIEANDERDDDFKIKLYIKEGVQLKEYRSTTSDNGNRIQYEARYKLDGIQNKPSKLIIIVEDIEEEKVEKIEIKPKWEKKTYNFFNKEDTLFFSLY